MSQGTCPRDSLIWALAHGGHGCTDEVGTAGSKPERLTEAGTGRRWRPDALRHGLRYRVNRCRAQQSGSHGALSTSVVPKFGDLGTTRDAISEKEGPPNEIYERVYLDCPRVRGIGLRGVFPGRRLHGPPGRMATGRRRWIPMRREGRAAQTDTEVDAYLEAGPSG